MTRACIFVGVQLLVLAFAKATGTWRWKRRWKLGPVVASRLLTTRKTNQSLHITKQNFLRETFQRTGIVGISTPSGKSISKKKNTKIPSARKVRSKLRCRTKRWWLHIAKDLFLRPKWYAGSGWWTEGVSLRGKHFPTRKECGCPLNQCHPVVVLLSIWLPYLVNSKTPSAK